MIEKTFKVKEFDDHETKIVLTPMKEEESPSHLDLTINSQKTDDSLNEKCNEVEERNNDIMELFKGVSMDQIMRL